MYYDDLSTNLDLIVKKLGGKIYSVDMIELFPGCPNPREDVLATVMYDKYDKPIFYINHLIEDKKKARLYISMLLSAVKLKKLKDDKIFILFSTDDFNNNEEIIMMATEIMIPTSLFIDLSNLYTDIELAEIFFVDIKWIKFKQKALLK